MKDAEEQINEILTLVKKCPQNLQEKCFELLFEQFFTQGKPNRQTSTPGDSIKTHQQSDKQDKGNNGETIKFHVRAKKLLDEGLTEEDINNLFYFEDGLFKTLYDDLKSKKMADSQIRITLLECLRTGLLDGEFKVSSEEVRKICEIQKCLDSPNFSTNFKKNKKFFKEEYKRGCEIQLSAEGKKELIKIAKEIAG